MKKVIGFEVAINDRGSLVCKVKGGIDTTETGVKIICSGDELLLKFSHVTFNADNHNNCVDIPKFEEDYNEA